MAAVPTHFPEKAPAQVTLHVWHVPTRAIPHAMARLARDRGALRRTPGLLFAKSLGTGDGTTFTLRDADPGTWALLATWSDPAAVDGFENGPVAGAWRRIADETWRLRLVPLSSRGRWSRREPFGPQVAAAADAPGQDATTYDGTVAAVTRARLAPRRARAFWRSVPAVSAELATADGLRWSLGIGEAPLGLQGTVSLWDSPAALTAFAYGRAAHRTVIARTRDEGWYAEELFARFAVVGSDGTIAGRDPAR